jgi:hypothetical protein
MKMATKRTRVLAHPHPKSKTLDPAGWAAQGGVRVYCPVGRCSGSDAWITCEEVRDNAQYATPSLRVSHVLRLMFWREGEGRRLVK